MVVEAALVVAFAVMFVGRRRGPGKHELTVTDSAPHKARSFPRPAGPPSPVVWPLPPGDGYVIKNDKRAWGTEPTIRSITDALARWNECATEFGLAYTLRVADISSPGGGALPPHLSHHEGRDVDVSVQGHGLPLDALPCLLRAFMADENVAVVYLDHATQGDLYELLEAHPEQGSELLPELQYPMSAGQGMTRIRHWRGHRDHIHVRYSR